MATYSKKVCLLGEFAVGKTSLVRRFVYNRFDDKYMSTIGVKVSRKTVSVPHQDGIDELNMLLWDLAGGEKFNPMWENYLRGAAGAVLVCDLTRKETLTSLKRYVDQLWSISPDARILVAANKFDLPNEHELSIEEIETLAKHLDTTCYLTSARQGDEVDSMFRDLGRILLAE